MLFPLVCFVLGVVLLFPTRSGASFQSEETQSEETPATTEPGSDGGETQNPSTTASDDESSSDSSNTGLIVLTVAVVIGVVLITMTIRSDRSRRGAPGNRVPAGWQSRATSITQEGREVVALTMPEDPRGVLTISQLGILESRLHILIASLRDAMMAAPSDRARSDLTVAAARAARVADIVEEVRRLHLSSVTADESMLDDLVSQLVVERTALDRALRDFALSSSSAGI
jgi:hypothetical protein